MATRGLRSSMHHRTVSLFVAAALVGCSSQAHHRSDKIVVPEDKHLMFTNDIKLISLSSPAPAAKAACREGMVEIEGDFCPSVRETCLVWVDVHGVASKEAIPKNGQTGRCGEFQKPTRCLSKTLQHLHYCIDRYEWPNIEGQKPKSWMSWYDAKRELEAAGKRLCTDIEWTFAAEGPDMNPIPYGDGYHRDRTACNFDNMIPKGISVFNAHKKGDATAEVLDGLLTPAGSMPRCVSPFGVAMMAGNIDEFVLNVSGHGRPYLSYMKGGHVFGVRCASRPATEAHAPSFSWYESGTRGCSDITAK